MRGRPIDELPVGERAEVTRVATSGDVVAFLDSIGDHNPIHHDRAFAAGTRFKEPIVPGLWTTGVVSSVLSTQLPGPGCIYVNQQVEFTRPVYFGDTITARVEVVERLVERNRLRLETVCVNQHGEDVMVGEAVVLPPKAVVAYAERKLGAESLVHWALQPWLWGAQTAATWARMNASALSTQPGRPAAPDDPAGDDG